MSSNDNLPAETTNSKATAVGLGLMLIGLIIAYFSRENDAGWVREVFLLIGGTSISVGLIALVFDVTLRRNVFMEMVRLVGIKESLSKHKITAASKVNEIDWANYLAGKRSFWLVLKNPSAWMEANLGRMLDRGRHKDIEVMIFVPDVDADYISHLAKKMKTDSEALKHSITDTVQRIENAWRGRQEAGRFAAKSSIEIRVLDAEPNYSIFSFDDLTIVSLSGVLGRQNDEVEFAYVHEGDLGAFPQSWFHSQLTDISRLPKIFESVIQSGEQQ